MARIIVVTSGKGGVGKTTTSASFASGLAMRGHKTAVIDFDVGLRNLDLIMGCERRVVYDFINVIQGESTLHQALIKDKRVDHLYILPASQTRDKEALTMEGVGNVLDELRETFDYIICVTVLMYLDHENLGKVVFDLIIHLKPGGRLILIEPHCSGRWFQTGFGIFPLLMTRIRRNTIHTGGRSFRINEIECCVRRAGGKILSENRLPVTSLFFLPMTLCAIMLPHGILKRIFKIVSRFDALSGVFKLPSIYVAYAITKND